MFLLFGVTVTVLIWVYLRWWHVKNYWAERNVPHLPPSPVFGSLSFLQQLNMGIWMRRMYEHFKTPYVGIWLFWRPALIINSPEIGYRVLVKDSANFRDRFARCGDSDPIGKLNLFALKDPDWTNIRRRMVGSFTTPRLRILQDFIHSKSKELVRRIQREQTSRASIKELFSDYSTDIIGTSAFGVPCNATLTGKDQLRSVTGEFMYYSTLRGVGWCCAYFFPELVDVFRFKFFPKPATDYFREIFKAAVMERETNGELREPRDLLDALLKVRKESAENNEGYSDDFIIAQAAIILSGGNETVGSILAFATYELAFNTKAQEKLYQELLEAKKHHGSDNFTSEQLSEMIYLNCVIKETLRKYSSMAWLDRVASADYKIDDKLTIKAGTPVYVNGVGMHYDPYYFPDPEGFVPERFSPENEKNIKPHTYMPFGNGPRICIGQRYGLMTVRYGMASIYLNYKVRPFPNTPKPVNVTIEKRGMLYSPGEPLCVEFIPRS